MRAASERRLALLALLLILLAAFALRVWRLGRAEIGGDEAFSYEYLTLPYLEIIRATVTFHEPHPVGSYFIFRTLRPFFGESEFALRFTSALAGVLTVALVYRLGRALHAFARFPSSGALIGAALMAFSPFSVYHSRELRMYALALMLTTAAAAFALSAWCSSRRRDLLAYALSGWSAMHMHYYTAATLIALNVFWLLRTMSARFSRQPVRLSTPAWLVAQLGVALAYAPWVWVAREAITAYAGNADFFELLSALLRSLGTFVAGNRVYANVNAYAAVSAAALAVGVAALLAARRYAALAFLLLYLGLPVAMVFAAAIARPIFRERYFIPALTGFHLIAGGGIGMLWQTRAFWGRIAAIGVTLPVGAATLIAARDYFNHWNSLGPDWRTLIRYVDQFSNAVPAERLRIVLNFPDPAFRYYYRGPARFMVMPYRVADYASAKEQVDEMVREDVARVIFQDVTSFWDGDRVATRALGTAFTQIEERFTGRWILKIFGRRTPEELRLLDAIFDGRITLRAGALFLDPSGEFVEVALQWSGAPNALRGSEKTYVHFAPAGRTDVALMQHDLFFAPEWFDGRVQLLSFRLVDVPPGEYGVRVGVYDPAQPSAPRLKLADGADGVWVGTFRWR
ncbi:MAG: glycosyltransferase family 39 protein [Anaerolineae bacterium]|nr:glycosyltransferase family 39 protein [Anaerolineae bacterium]